MKIKVEFELGEMDKMHQTMLDVAEEFDVDAPDSLFVKRKVNLKSIQIDQQIGAIDIDVDSNFIIWCLDKLVGLSKFIKPVWMFIERGIHELKDWITPIDNINEEDVQKELNV